MQTIILVTGASSGIGKTTALELIKDGHIVYGAARRVEKMEDLVKSGGHRIKLDLTNEKEIDEVVKKIISEHGRIDVLINNAGYSTHGSVEDISIEDARKQFEVNLFGLASLTQKVLPHMRLQKSGHIINISSVGGKIYFPLAAWYHASKHALEGWSDCLRLESKQFNIKVTIIEPGIILKEEGGIPHQTLLERSKNSPYLWMARAIVQIHKKIYNESSASSPITVSRVIKKAIKSKNPKTRYPTGKKAHLTLFLRKWLSDKLFDKLMYFQLKRNKSDDQ